MAHQFTTSYIEDSRAIFQQYKRWADQALEQLNEEELLRQIDEESNSIAVIVKHMAGNMRSRWTNFLNSDGEKPDRNRDMEFVAPPSTKTDLMRIWEEGWRCLFDALEPLTDADLERAVTIRGEKHSVMQAIQRQVAHYSLHVGQIILLAKHYRGIDWKTVSVPKNRSREFNARVLSGELSQR